MVVYRLFVVFSVQLCWSDIRATGDDRQATGAGHRVQDNGAWHGVNARQKEGR